MESTRQLKLSKLILKELSMIFLKDLSHTYGSSMLSVSVVRISPDLGYAKIFLSILKNPKEIIEKINNENKHIRHLLAKKIKNQVRIVPELSFHLDDSSEYFYKIDGIISNLNIPPEKTEE